MTTSMAGAGHGEEAMRAPANPAMPGGHGRPAVDAGERLIVALDVPSIAEARGVIDALGGTVRFYKLGPWLTLAPGFEQLIDDLLGEGIRIFLDTKGFDIPATMRAGVAAAAGRGVSFLTIHGGGEATREAITAAVEGKKGTDLKVLAVTVLSSLNAEDLAVGGREPDVATLVKERAQKALECGCDGVVASGREIGEIRALAGEQEFLIVAPGVRPAGAGRDDHKRAVTPALAIGAGADYLVVGRPIVRDAAPRRATERLLDEMQSAFDG